LSRPDGVRVQESLKKEKPVAPEEGPAEREFT
jgi:hypothetical protein